jgi:predicted naringenin-chalcone synthase
MATFIHGIQTAVPRPRYDQAWACSLVEKHATERPGLRRVIRSLYRNSGIDGRHSVIDDWNPDSPHPPLFFGPDGERLPPPSTGTRNAVYTREARHLFAEVGQLLLDQTPGIEPEDITHVITISCTGFFAPGPDYHVVRALGLAPQTERYHIGFMGCHAAFQGLRMAHAFCAQNPDAVVLVISVELCTLHLQFTEETDDLIAGALFADGAAGVLVSARAPAPGALRVELSGFHSDLTREGEGDMAWTIADEGFRMRLSTYVPQILSEHLEPLLSGMGRQLGFSADEVDRWAVHPGGRAIVDRVEEGLGGVVSGMASSRAVLAEYGNMSSATVLFVLAHLFRDTPSPTPDVGPEKIVAMAFGPGLSIEAGLLLRHSDP